LSSAPPQLPLDYAVVPFEPTEEKWNTYEFSDGTTISFRIIVTRIARRKESPSGQYDITTNNIVTVAAPPTERGQPTAIMTAEEMQAADKFEVRPIATEEHWNVYRLVSTDDILKVKYVATGFFRLKGRFDQFGEPMYLVVGGPLVTPQPKFGKQGQVTV
jgi:hypothetical protein